MHLLAVHHRPGEGDLLEGLPLPGGRGLGRRPDAGPLGHLGLDEGHHPPSPRVPDECGGHRAAVGQLDVDDPHALEGVFPAAPAAGAVKGVVDVVGVRILIGMLHGLRVGQAEQLLLVVVAVGVVRPGGLTNCYATYSAGK